MSQRAKDDLKYLKSKKGVRIAIGYSERIYSDQLEKSYDVQIYFPHGESYSEGSIAYLLEGSNTRNYVSVVGQLGQVSQKVGALVVVKGIAVNQMVIRRSPLKEGSKMDAIIRFLDQDVIPFIESKHSLSGNRVVLGDGFEAVLVCQLAFSKPELFNQYLMVNPVISDENAPLLWEIVEEGEESASRKPAVMVADGGAEKFGKIYYKRLRKEKDIDVQYKRFKDYNSADELLLENIDFWLK